MNTATAPTVELYLPTLPVVTPLVPLTAKIERYSAGTGGNPASLGVSLPCESVVDRASLAGAPVYAFRNGVQVFAGVVVEADGAIARGTQDLQLNALDMRHELNAQVIGQYGLGAVATLGGWAGVGYDVVFNRDGVPNRSAAIDPVTGVSTFDLTEDAEWWTFDEILAFLFLWYVPTAVMKLDRSLLVGPYLEAAPEIDVRNMRAGAAIDAVTKTMGGTWYPRYTATRYVPVIVPTPSPAPAPVETPLADLAPTYYPVHSQIPAPATRTLFVDDGKALYPPTEYIVDQLRLRHSAADSYDRLEVVSAPVRVETTYASNGTAPLLTRVTTGSELTDGDACYFDVDVTQYTAHGVGLSLDAGSLPKKWDGNLVTRRNSAGYLAGPLVSDEGDPVRAVECIQLSRDGGTLWSRVKSGVRLDLEKMRVCVSRKGSVYGITKTENARAYNIAAGAESSVHVKVTITTIVEYPLVAVTEATSLYLARSRTRRILRRDFVPMSRMASEVPDLAAVNPNTFTTLAPGTALAKYRDPEAEMIAIRDRLFDARSELEVSVSANLPASPLVDIGDNLETWPLVLWSTTQPVRVLRVEFDPDRIDLKIQATNNIDGAFS